MFTHLSQHTNAIKKTGGLTGRPSRSRSAAKTVVAASALAAACSLASCASAPPPADPEAQLATAHPQGVTVYVVYNHFHSGLTVPTREIASRPGATASALAQLKPQRWTSLGYGDAKFYEQRGVGPARVLDFFRSMLAPNNPSVVHLEGFDDPLNDPSHPRILKLVISGDHVDDLVRRVDASFALTHGAPEFLVQGEDANDRFYRGLRPASAIHECNQWIGEVLGAAGIPHTAVLDTTSDGLAFDLKASGRAIDVTPTPRPPTAQTRN